MSPVRLKWQKVAMLLLPPLLIIILIVLVMQRQPSCNFSYRDDSSFQSVLKYCNSPDEPVSGQEGTVPQSDGFTLESVSVVIRHGDRNNLHSLPKAQPLELDCEIDEDMADLELRQFASSMKKQQENHKNNPKTSTFHSYQLYPNSAECESGELTLIGAAQHIHNGEFLKKRYEALGLFKRHEGTPLEDSVEIRTTTYTRTFQSAIALLYGFLPELDMSKLAIDSAKTNQLCSEKGGKGGVQCDCPSIKKDIDIMASSQLQFSPEVMSQKISRTTYEEVGSLLGVLVGQLPKPTHMLDITLVHACHGGFLPGRHSSDTNVCMASNTAKNLYDILLRNGAQQVETDKYQRLARLKMYPLLSDIEHHLAEVAAGKTKTFFQLFAGHDTSIEPLMAALGASDGHWPRYASRVVFEMYSTKDGPRKDDGDGSKDYLLRVLYDGKVVTHKLPGCRKNMYKHNLGLCLFSHFQRLMTHFLADYGENGDYRKLCNTFGN